MRSRGVLLLDLKDVLVQGPPWPLLAPGRVTVFEEIGQIQHAAWNQCARTHTAHTTARRQRPPQPTPVSSLALPCGGVCRYTPMQPQRHMRPAATQYPALTWPPVLCAGVSWLSSRRA